jgi:branched-chain amino acid transport system substrate-binding protein
MVTRRNILGGLAALPLTTVKWALWPEPASAQGPIKLGFFGPLTGRLSALGVEARRGAEFAIREFNEVGGLGGRKVELVLYDDRGDRKEAVSVVRKLIESDNVVAIDNGSLSLTSIAAAPVVNEAKIPMVIAYANAVGAVKGHDYAFRWCSVADVQGWVMAHHAIKKKTFKTFAMFVQEEEYGRGIANGAERGIEKLGGKIAYKKLFSPGEKEFRAFLTEVKALNVDALFASAFSSSLTALCRQGWDLGVFPKAQFYGSCTMTEIDWFEGIGAAGEGAIGVLEFIQTAPDPATAAFVQRWQKTYNTNIVSHQAGLTYDATRLLLDAMKRGGLTPAGIHKALRETKDFKNLSGVNVSFTELREPLLPLAIGQWDGQLKNFKLLEFVTDPALIDPRPWYQYYK